MMEWFANYRDTLFFALAALAIICWVLYLASPIAVWRFVFGSEKPPRKCRCTIIVNGDVKFDKTYTLPEEYKDGERRIFGNKLGGEFIILPCYFFPAQGERPIPIKPHDKCYLKIETVDV